jgi:cadmium resistance protein CadD (predicted permease)
MWNWGSLPGSERPGRVDRVAVAVGDHGLMSEIVGVVLGAIGVFAATNVDDVVVVTALFGVARHEERTASDLTGSEIVGGQYLGFIALVLVSLVIAVGLLSVEDHWVGLLGLVPIGIGVRALIRARHPEARSTPAVAGMTGVAAVTIANGADNISVYAPVFRQQGLADNVAYVVVFMAGVAALCWTGRYLGTRGAVRSLLERTGHWLVPVVFIAIGVAVIVEAGTVGWLAS